MSFVVTKPDKTDNTGQRKLYYAGYQCENLSNSGVIWLRTARGVSVRFDEPTADAIVRQIEQMNVPATKELLREKRKRHV